MVRSNDSIRKKKRIIKQVNKRSITENFQPIFDSMFHVKFRQTSHAGLGIDERQAKENS